MSRGDYHIGGEDRSGFDIDEFCTLFASSTRRAVVQLIADTMHEGAPTEITLQTLADSLVDVSKATDAVGQSHEALQIELHHCHLPKLDAGGVIDYDPASWTVRPAEHPVYSRLATSTMDAIVTEHLQ